MSLFESSCHSDAASKYWELKEVGHSIPNRSGLQTRDHQFLKMPPINKHQSKLPQWEFYCVK